MIMSLFYSTNANNKLVGYTDVVYLFDPYKNQSQNMSSLYVW